MRGVQGRTVPKVIKAVSGGYTVPIATQRTHRAQSFVQLGIAPGSRGRGLRPHPRGVMLPSAAIAAPGGPPHPVADTITTTEGAPASGNVLSNDTNGGQGTLTVTRSSGPDPSVGTLNIDANGDYTFTPAADWFGTATATYDVANDKHTRTGTITINVSNIEDEPTANDDDVTVDEDTATDVTSQLLGNDTDPTTTR